MLGYIAQPPAKPIICYICPLTTSYYAVGESPGLAAATVAVFTPEAGSPTFADFIAIQGSAMIQSATDLPHYLQVLFSHVGAHGDRLSVATRALQAHLGSMVC